MSESSKEHPIDCECFFCVCTWCDDLEHRKEIAKLREALRSVAIWNTDDLPCWCPDPLSKHSGGCKKARAVLGIESSEAYCTGQTNGDGTLVHFGSCPVCDKARE